MTLNLQAQNNSVTGSGLIEKGPMSKTQNSSQNSTPQNQDLNPAAIQHLSLEAQLPIYWVPVLGSLYKFILSITQEPTRWVPGLLGYSKTRKNTLSWNLKSPNTSGTWSGGSGLVNAVYGSPVFCKIGYVDLIRHFLQASLFQKKGKAPIEVLLNITRSNSQ